LGLFAPREAEIQDRYGVALAHHDVPGLQVAVRDAFVRYAPQPFVI
jgi:hypothetical protein